MGSTQQKKAASEREGDDKYSGLANVLRSGGKRGVETRSAVIGAEDVSEQERVEFFRGKDFVRALRKHHRPTLDELVPPGSANDEGEEKQIEPGSFSSRDEARRTLVRRAKFSVDTRAERLGDAMLQNGYFSRVERRYNKYPLKHGKKRVKFPKYLEPCAEQSFDKDGFYAWRYERPASAWSYVYSALLVIAVLACCLFQVAPSRVKLVVFYSTLSLFGLLVSTLLIRALLFAIVWTLTGKYFWLLPNLLSDDAPTVFKPLYKFDKTHGESTPLWKRLSFVGALSAAIGASYFSSPSGTTAKVSDATRYAHDQMLDLLNLRQDMSSINGSTFAENNSTSSRNL